LSISNVADIAIDVMKQNKFKLQQVGVNGRVTIYGTVKGVKYKMGVAGGRVIQLFPK